MPRRQTKPKRTSARAKVYPTLDDEFRHVEELEKRSRDEAPARGEQWGLEEDYSDNPTPFADLPLSRRTAQGLAEAGFEHCTPIQAAAIPHALAKRDVLGAAKTGSGKTLSFLVPALELLWREKWSALDGLGALIVSPTRELALQIFDVLRQVGKHHTFSAGLITGGKKEFREEQSRVCTMSLLVATPGRLVQHLEQTAGFDVSSCRILILDEADRILDLGFADQVDTILASLPADDRQTMLFSATQTRSVQDLARLSLRQPEYVAVNDKAAHVTPAKLAQHYCVCPLEQKLDVLFSFIKAHLKSKAIVFLATCSQVRFVYECFRGLQPGVPLMCLHGKHKQARRTSTYLDFVRKPAAFLLATDIAARGLDFPDVDWVIQLDCPEDAAMYIHRVGRTARYTAAGRSLLFLLPTEERPMLQVLAKARVPALGKLNMNPRKRISVTQRAGNIVAANPQIKQLANKAFTSYLRSVHLMPNKRVFPSANALHQDAFATSLGLATKPVLNFLDAPVSDEEEEEEEGGEDGEGEGAEESRDRKARGKAEQARAENRQHKNVNKKLARLKEQIKQEKLRRKRAREGDSEGSGSGNAAAGSEPGAGGGDSPQDDLLTFKGRLEPLKDQPDRPTTASGRDRPAKPNATAGGEVRQPALSWQETSGRTKARKLRIDASGTGRGLASNKRIKFDDDTGAAIEVAGTGFAQDNAMIDHQRLVDKNEEFVSRVRARLEATAAQDKADARSRIKDKHNKKRHKLKDLHGEATGEAPTLFMGGEEEAGGSEGMDWDSGRSDGEADAGVEADEDAVLRMIRGT